MDGLLVVALVLAGVPAVIGLANLVFVTPPQGRVPDKALVSILIRARNAEPDVEACIAHALGQIGVAVEVIVLDDGSLDHTGELLTAMARHDGRFHRLACSPTPRGWTREAHAWAQLAAAAWGTHFLFVDASVRLDPHAAAALTGQSARRDAGLVSGIPRQHLRSVGAGLAVPLRGLLATILPGGGGAASRLPGLAMACEDLTLVRRADFDRIGGHACVNGAAQPMPELARAMRRHGIRTDMVDATGLAGRSRHCGLREAWAGMTRMPAGPAALLSGMQVLPFALLPAPRAMLALLLVAALRIGVAARVRENWWVVPLHPIAMGVLAAAQGMALIHALLSRAGLRPPSAGRLASTARG